MIQKVRTTKKSHNTLKIKMLRSSDRKNVHKKQEDTRLYYKDNMGMANIAVGCRGQLFIDAIDLSGCEKLFNVGDGPGSYSILACKKYPGLKAVVFDSPETIKIAREMIAKEGSTTWLSSWYRVHW